MPADILPCTETKIDYAKSIINLFPKLRDRNSTQGFEAFFDPITKRGFITNRLRNLFRDRPSQIDTRKQDDVDHADEIERSVQDKIEFLKFATADQKDEIFNATKETFCCRTLNRDNLAKRFPRFLDTDGLISLEFSLMHPGKENQFKEIFPSLISVIPEVYKQTASAGVKDLLKESADSDGMEYYHEHTNNFNSFVATYCFEKI